ncbi:MAG: T9SS type A sorting domain-containing protein [Bacteroidales bacterium]|nr:T9SS type A sorting domain-containing protein [Bacteroidales bacterium]
MVDILTEQKHIKRTAGALAINGCMEMNDYFGQAGWGWFTTDTWIFFGDPSLMVRTDVPAELIVSNEVILTGVPYTTVVSSDNGPVEGAKICLSQGENYYLGITDEFGYVSIENELLPGTALIVVTAYNAKTIYQDITVVPPEGPYVIYQSVEINDETGNNNQLTDYGETVKLTITINNVGIEQADDVAVSVASTDEFVTITDGIENYGNIPAGETATITDGFELEVNNLIPDEHLIAFDLSATDGLNTWESGFYLFAHAPVLELSNFIISGNGTIDPGETAEITVSVENSGSSDAFNVFGELLSSDPFIAINTGQQAYGNLPAGGGMAEQVFSITADVNTPAGHTADFNFDISADAGITGNGSFYVIIGQIPVLILDMDGNNNSGNPMQTCLENLDISFEYITTFPADLSLYTSVFVCLGVDDGFKHVLSNNEGQALADYLNIGGNLYMEGGDTWYYDNQTSVQPMFNIDPEADGTNNLGTINGMSSTFTEGMSFNYSGGNEWIDHISAISPAFDILENQSPNYGTGVAYDAGSYKTIGTSHEFGGLDDGTSPSTKEELMEQYLEFFGITQILQATFIANTTNTCTEEIVNFYDQSSGGAISWEWTFEGGSPATSSSQNPLVVYFNPGIFDVTLTVSDGVEFSTIIIEDYITVVSAPQIPGTPTGDDEVCTNFILTSDYVTTGAMYSDSYVWEISPADAGIISGNSTTGTVEWTTNWEGTATIRVKGTNAECGEGEFSEGFEVVCSICTGISEYGDEAGIRVYPNPSTGQFTVKFENNIGVSKVIVVNMLNEALFERFIKTENGNAVSFDLSNYAKGVYFVRIKTVNSQRVRKIVLR